MAIFWIRISKKLTNYRELASASTNETLTEIRTVRELVVEPEEAKTRTAPCALIRPHRFCGHVGEGPR